MARILFLPSNRSRIRCLVCSKKSGSTLRKGVPAGCRRCSSAHVSATATSTYVHTYPVWMRRLPTKSHLKFQHCPPRCLPDCNGTTVRDGSEVSSEVGSRGGSELGRWAQGGQVGSARVNNRVLTQSKRSALGQQENNS